MSVVVPVALECTVGSGVRVVADDAADDGVDEADGVGVPVCAGDPALDAACVGVGVSGALGEPVGCDVLAMDAAPVEDGLPALVTAAVGNAVAALEPVGVGTSVAYADCDGVGVAAEVGDVAADGDDEGGGEDEAVMVGTSASGMAGTHTGAPPTPDPRAVNPTAHASHAYPPYPGQHLHCPVDGMHAPVPLQGAYPVAATTAASNDAGHASRGAGQSARQAAPSVYAHSSPDSHTRSPHALTRDTEVTPTPLAAAGSNAVGSVNPASASVTRAVSLFSPRPKLTMIGSSTVALPVRRRRAITGHATCTLHATASGSASAARTASTICDTAADSAPLDPQMAAATGAGACNATAAVAAHALMPSQTPHSSTTPAQHTPFAACTAGVCMVSFVRTNYGTPVGRDTRSAMGTHEVGRRAAGSEGVDDAGTGCGSGVGNGGGD